MYILVYLILVVTTYNIHIPTLKYFYFANVSESDVIYALLGNENEKYRTESS